MQGEMRLIPYFMDEMMVDANEIPKGIDLIQAPSMWKNGLQGKGYDHRYPGYRMRYEPS